jgi:hypothetical protein
MILLDFVAGVKAENCSLELIGGNPNPAITYLDNTRPATVAWCDPHNHSVSKCLALARGQSAKACVGDVEPSRSGLPRASALGLSTVPFIFALEYGVDAVREAFDE